MATKKGGAGQVNETPALVSDLVDLVEAEAQKVVRPFTRGGKLDLASATAVGRVPITRGGTGRDDGQAEPLPGSVTAAKIAVGAVGPAALAANAVTTPAIADAAVTTAELGDLAVTTPKLADDAVTQAKIADDAVGSAQIAAAAVGTTELADTSVTDAKVATGIAQSKIFGLVSDLAARALLAGFTMLGRLILKSGLGSDCGLATPFGWFGEHNGIMYWAINAQPDGSNWNRVDTTKTAILLLLDSNTGDTIKGTATAVGLQLSTANSVSLLYAPSTGGGGATIISPVATITGNTSGGNWTPEAQFLLASRRLQVYAGATTDYPVVVRVWGDTTGRSALRADGFTGYGDGTNGIQAGIKLVSANRLQSTDLFQATLGVAIRVKSGVPVDGDWASAPPDGTLVLNSATGDLYCRTLTVWKKVTLT